jgi:2,4-dienoyl-CoA reductase-like NADH-dependent reductase (Old Yellow Enzyme family)
MSSMMTDVDQYRRIFQSLTLRGKQLRSRIYVPAHQPGLADNGAPGERYIAYHRRRARAGVGMQITGATPIIWSEVWADGKTLVNIDDRIIPGYQKLAAAVHDEGGLILAQLAHVGAMETAGSEIVSASRVHSEVTLRTARAAREEDLAFFLDRYAAAARRCREGQLDGIELTMAHGMLLASFLSPLMNQRSDQYGGNIEGRTLFPRQVLSALRAICGTDMILGVRLSSDELTEGGLRIDEGVRIAARLVATGDVDYVTVIAGNNSRKLARVDHWPPTPAPHGLFRHLARAVKETIGVPVAAVGRITTPDLAEDILRRGDADLVGMVRAHVADPDLLLKAKAGQAATIRPCVGANLCINTLLDHQSLRCFVNPEAGHDPVPAAIGRGRIAVVVGGGPAGLEAARQLALRQFAVTLFEKTAAVGGQMRLWANTPSRREFGNIIDWWRAELERLGVDLRCKSEAGVATIQRLKADLVIVATGSAPVARQLPTNGRFVPQMTPYEAIQAEPGHKIVVCDEVGRLGAMVIAEQLAQRWTQVILVTSALHPGEGEGITTVYPLLRDLARHRVIIIDRAKAVCLSDATLQLRGVFDEPRASIADVDLVCSFVGSESDDLIAAALHQRGIASHVIGDAKIPGDAGDAILGAATTVSRLDRELDTSTEPLRRFSA